MNPYELLGISQQATLTEIEDAYDAAFDENEARAQGGDSKAIELLNRLNEARETLVDPERRAALDRNLARLQRKQAPPPPRAAAPAPQPVTKPAPTQQNSTSRPPRASNRGSTSSTPIRTKRRASYAVTEVRPQRTFASILPYFIVIVLLGFGLAMGITYLVSQGDCVPDDLPAGATVATVNGAAIYERDLEERYTLDKAVVVDDPLFQAFFSPDTITGTRALDSFKFDSLDKLINLEIIKQQAQKENLWPTDAQREQLVRETAAQDQLPGEDFNDMLCRLQISEAKYRRTVLDNIIYTVMADRYVPKEGTAAERTDGWIRWICSTRQNYDVQLFKTFLVPNNPPCTSGLPADLPLPGVDMTPVPEDIPTAVAPVASPTASEATGAP